MRTLPVTLRPDERRDLAQRLAERLGTKTAGGMALLAREEAGRLVLEGAAGDIKIKGVQEVGARQRDTIAIGGLEGGLGVVIEVDEAVPGALRDAPTTAPAGLDGPPAHVRLEAKTGTDEARAAALAEAFRFAGERFAASLAKGKAMLLLPPLAPLDEKEARRHVRGRWGPLEGAHLDTRPPAHLVGLAAVQPLTGAGPRLLVRPSRAAPRAAVPIALLHDGLTLAHIEVDRALEGKAIDKALAAITWDLVQQTAAEPRPAPDPVTIAETDGPFETCALTLDRRARAQGTVRGTAAGKGARLAALDLRLETPDGKPCGIWSERHLLGLPGEGFVLMASASLTATTAVVFAAPAAKLEKWILRLGKALGK